MSVLRPLVWLAAIVLWTVAVANLILWWGGLPR